MSRNLQKNISKFAKPTQKLNCAEKAKKQIQFHATGPTNFCLMWHMHAMAPAQNQIACGSITLLSPSHILNNLHWIVHNPIQHH